MEYRNIKTGIVIEVSSEINGENWEPVKKAPVSSVEKKEDTENVPVKKTSVRKK